MHSIAGIVQESGKKFWSTDDTGPFDFKIGLGKVIEAWDQGVATMQVRAGGATNATQPQRGSCVLHRPSRLCSLCSSARRPPSRLTTRAPTVTMVRLRRPVSGLVR